MANTQQQYGRVCKLVVSRADLSGVDLSDLRIKFSVKRSDTVTPNSADIRVYNLSEETSKQIRDEFTQVTLQAGYEGNYGVIFQGNIKQVILGRESSTDTFIDIVAGDGDRAYNFAIVNTSLAKGSTSMDQVQTAVNSMNQKGVGAGQIDVSSRNQLPRGKVMYGNARAYLSEAAATTGTSWSIQNEKINMIPITSYLPGEVVVINSKTGLIGTPQQTNEGVNLKCLLNPLFRIAGRVQIDNAAVAALKINLSVVGSPANTPPSPTADGVYYILVVEHQGDTRSLEWYSNLVCLSVDPTENPRNSVGGTF